MICARRSYTLYDLYDCEGSMIRAALMVKMQSHWLLFNLDVNVVHVAEISVRNGHTRVQAFAFKDQIHLAFWTNLFFRPKCIDDPGDDCMLRHQLVGDGGGRIPLVPSSQSA